MSVLKRFSPNFIAGFWLVLMVVTWLAFAPTQAGGMASYIVVIGNSMEPRFHIGDLVITHKEAEYQIGDAVVYKNQELKNFVFHRIITEERGTFTLQGDNNSWTDTYQPSQAEIIGKLWLHLPKGGVYIQTLRIPFVMALAAGTLAGFVLLTLFHGKARGNKRMTQKSISAQFASLKQKLQNWLTTSDKPGTGGTSDPMQGNILETWFFTLGALALAFFILGIMAFSRPASRIVKDDVSFEHVGFFSYSAPAPQGVYDSDAIQSGDPIFPKLTCAVDVSFQYTFIGQDAANIAGTHQLIATISESVSGWQRSIPLQDATAFTGNAFGTSAKLNLCQLEKLAQSMEDGTEFHPGAYTLTISPNIHLTGDLAGRPLDGSFNPSLPFNYDRIHFYLLQNAEQGNSLNPAETGALSKERQTFNTILLFGMELAVPALRWFALIGLLGSLAGVTLLGMKLQALSKSDQSRFIRMRYNSMLVDIHQTMLVNIADIVDVNSIDDLAKLAEKFNAMILHSEHGDSHTYYVRVEGATYRFVLPAETGSTVPEGEASL
jgi:signal peptidase I